MKKVMIIGNIMLCITLFYVLNLKYYDRVCNKNGCYNYEERIIDLVKRIIVERGGI